MADKDRKLKVVLKLPKPVSAAHTSLSSVALQNVQAQPCPSMSQKPASHVGASDDSNRLPTPPKKRKFKALVESHAVGVAVKDGVAVSSTRAAVGSQASGPLRVRVSLPPLVKKPLYKKEMTGANQEEAAPMSNFASVQSMHVRDPIPPPSRQILEGVLEKLKMKDTYGVFSEPVDSRLVPDYYDVIKVPMDFGTMYNKISDGIYTTLNLFEKDIMLICSNAMRYNGPDTIYYKQARSIQDAARKALDVIVSQKGGPDSGKHTSNKKLPYLKKASKNAATVKTSLELANSDFASGATLDSDPDKVALLNKAEVSRAKKGTASVRLGNLGGDSEAVWSVPAASGGGGFKSKGLRTDSQQAFRAVPKAAPLKDPRKPLSTQEYHRSSYKPRNLPAHGRGPLLAGVSGEFHHLVPTGYHTEQPYAKSLALFAVSLGPRAWKCAAGKMQRVLAPFVPFGPGWIGENEAPPNTVFKPIPVLASVTGSALCPTEVKVTKPALMDEIGVPARLSSGILAAPERAITTPLMTVMDTKTNGEVSQVSSQGKPMRSNSPDSMIQESKPQTAQHFSSTEGSHGIFIAGPRVDKLGEDNQGQVCQIEEG